ncbi:hypothetical protein DEO72_LG3g1662 [Vigna unguiculata]|uniref:Uncharacterized protein n=1 Tax=Vigna unguiculata TaxID=3917 RepID=A0A4D6LET2_VIGUN|nr:hypothetical protein DEO72_LG3g1662 [Vigna unguiculata]
MAEHQSNHKNLEPTPRELLQQILELRDENEQIHQRADEPHNRANKAREEHLVVPWEEEEARRGIEDML